jgi:hypothetical protein
MTVEMLPPAEANGPRILGLALPGQEIIEATCFVAPKDTPLVEKPNLLPPQGIEDLELPNSMQAAVDATLGQQIMAQRQKFYLPSLKPKDLAIYRHDITRSLDATLAKTDQLDIVDYRQGVSPPEARDEVLYGVELVASELLQNAMRYGGGIGGVDLGRTPDGKLYVAVRNLRYELPKNTMHLREGRRPLMLGTGALRSSVENVFADDEHGRGIALMSRFAEQGGMLRILCPEVKGIPIQGSSELAPVKEVVSYAIFGKPKPGMNLHGFIDLTDEL